MDRRKQEVRERILGAAFDLFLDQGVSGTTIEDICERADVANRTFFNHFATRNDMMRALAEERLLNLRDVVFDRENEPIPARLIGLFDGIAATMFAVERYVSRGDRRDAGRRGLRHSTWIRPAIPKRWPTPWSARSRAGS